MVPLLERGRIAYRKHTLERQNVSPDDRDMLVGTGRSIDVVTYEDFLENTSLVLHHVVSNGHPTHILCENGAICSLIERRLGK